MFDSKNGRCCMMPCNLWNPFESCWRLQKTSSKPFDALRLETHGGSIMKKNRHKRRPRFTKRRSLEFPCEHMLYASTCLHYRYPEMQSTGSQNQANQSRMMNVHQWLTTAVSPSIANLRKRIILYFCTKILWVRRIPKDCLDVEPPIEEWAINCSRRSNWPIHATPSSFCPPPSMSRSVSQGLVPVPSTFVQSVPAPGSVARQVE